MLVIHRAMLWDILVALATGAQGFMHLHSFTKGQVLLLLLNEITSSLTLPFPDPISSEYNGLENESISHFDKIFTIG